MTRKTAYIWISMVVMAALIATAMAPLSMAAVVGGESPTESGSVQVPFNTPPEADEAIVDLEFNEDTTYVLNLDDYFYDPDGTTLIYSADTPDHLTLSIDGSMLSIVPDRNWHGSEGFVVYASDGEYSTSAVFQCLVLPVSEYPIVNGIVQASGKEDTAMFIDLSDYLDDDWYALSIDAGADLHSYVLNNVWLHIQPSRDWNGEESIEITAYYNSTGDPQPPTIFSTNTEDLKINVTLKPINDAPEAITDILPVEFNEDNTLYVDMSSYIMDVDSPISFYAQSSADISASFDGSILKLQPASNWHGTENVEVYATDGEYTTSLPVKCTVDPVADFEETNGVVKVPIPEDSTVDIDLTDYLDPNWVDLQIQHNGENLTYTVDDNGQVHIVPPKDWNGEETFNITAIYNTILDPSPPSLFFVGSPGKEEIDLNVAVLPVNDPPVVVDTPSVSFNEDTKDTIDLYSIFSDVDNPQLTFSADSENRNVSLSISDDGKLHISPAKNWNGFTNIVVSAFDGSLTATTEIPCRVIDNPDISMKEDNTMYFDLSPYFKNGAVSMKTEVIQGNIKASADKENMKLDLSPGANWNGHALVNITAYYYDLPSIWGASLSSVQMISVTRTAEINVAPVNDPPKAVSTPSLAGVEDSDPLTVDLSKYFTDIDSTLTYSVSAPEGLSASIDGSILTLSPEPNWFGSVNLTVTASDGEYEVTSEIPVTIKGVDDPPVVLETAPSEEYIDEDTLGTIDLSQVFADIDSELEYSIETADGLNGKISGSTLILMPARDWNGDSRVTIVATDGNYTVNRTIHVHVLSVDDSPVAKMNSYSVGGVEDNPISLDVAAFFSDVDSSLVYSYTGGKHLNVQIDQNGKATITPEKNWHGKSMLCFTASDGKYTTKIPVTVYISPANDMPTSTRDSIVLDAEREKAVSIDLSKYFSDPDGDSLTYTYSAPQGVRVSIEGNIATIEVSRDAQPDEKVMFIASDGKSQASIETHIISMPLESDAQNPPPELPDMSTASTGSGVSPVTAYGAIFLSLGMAALALAYAVLYLRQEKPDRRYLH